MRGFLVLCVLLLPALGAGCGKGRETPGEQGEPFPAADFLVTAKDLHRVGLWEQALSLCDEIQERAPGTEEALASRFLAADAHMALADTDRAAETYRQIAEGFPDRAREAGLRLARLHASVWNWREALAVIEGLEKTSGVDEGTREELGRLKQKIGPMESLKKEFEVDFSRARAACTEFFKGKRTSPPPGLWLPEVPTGASLDSDHLTVVVQRPICDVFHPLGWTGSSFRLTVEFNLKSVTLEELTVTLGIGVMSRTHLTRMFKGDSRESLSFVIVAQQYYQDVEKLRRLRLERSGESKEGQHSFLFPVVENVMLDEWYRMVLEYSREFGEVRITFIKVDVGKGKVLHRFIRRDVPPFRQDLPYVIGFLPSAASNNTRMEVKVKRIRFETAEGSDAAVDWAFLTPRLLGYAAFSMGHYDVAAEQLRRILGKDRHGFYHFFLYVALKRMRKSDEDPEVAGLLSWFEANREKVPPAFIDFLVWVEDRIPETATVRGVLKRR
jgi:tetratricopeptide (TPR) repeat protein